jgi:hypothetical protein
MTASLSRYVLVLVSTPNPHGAHMPLDDGANAALPSLDGSSVFTLRLTPDHRNARP